ARLQESNPGGLATLLSISSAFEGFGASARSFVSADGSAANHPLDFVEELDELRFDRFFARVSDGMLGWLGKGTRTFSTAPHALHKDSFTSFKEVRYPEGNVQFTFSRREETLIVDSDIDLFGDTGAHLLLEILPTDVLHANPGTDPRQAYAFRWM